MQTSQRSTLGLMDRALIGMLLFIVILLFGIEAARAAEIVPSIGITKAIDNPGGSAKTFGGLALRTTLAPMVKAEIGAAYRSESYLGGDLTMRMVPLTASLWASPVPMLYAGGGVGMYVTTLGYREALALPDQTTKKFGAHLGGGLSFPVAPRAALDLNGRYVFMEQQTSQLPPNQFNPDFWSTSLGLALKF